MTDMHDNPKTINRSGVYIYNNRIKQGSGHESSSIYFQRNNQMITAYKITRRSKCLLKAARKTYMSSSWLPVNINLSSLPIIKLDFVVPPKIDNQGPQFRKVIVGESVELPCNVSGIPRPRVMWQKGTRILAGSAGQFNFMHF